MSVTNGPGSTAWIPGRGDYGTDHASDLVEIIERLNCSKGCTRSGTEADRRVYGPSGTCELIAFVELGDPTTPIPELDPRADGPHCRARVEPPPPVPQPLPPPTGMDPLFDLGDLS